jgi:hypothetical protein
MVVDEENREESFQAIFSNLQHVANGKVFA